MAIVVPVVVAVAVGSMSKSNQSRPSPKYASDVSTVPPAAVLDTANPYSMRCSCHVTAVPEPGCASISAAYHASHAAATAVTAATSAGSTTTVLACPAVSATAVACSARPSG